MRQGLIAVALVWCAVAREAAGQLAITEAMSAASTNLGSVYAGALADFWELTNFGTNTINLTGYKWRDSTGGATAADSGPFTGLFIAGGESIVFVESNATSMATAQQFRDWWGAGLPNGVRIVLYDGANKGLNNTVDGVRLWEPNATDDSGIIDAIKFGKALRGTTFTYHPETGEFGEFSRNGATGAFKAATRDDVGSPGVSNAPIPLRIWSQPASLDVCAGGDATFTVRAAGLPRPAYQWFYNGAAMAGERSSRLTIANPQTANAGQYQVEVSNAFAVERSDILTLSVRTDPSPPLVSVAPADISVVVRDVARFSATVCAFPPPDFQWLSNGVPIAGATSRNLVILDCKTNMSASYCLQISNTNGSTNVCAQLTVSPRPSLVITEIMASNATNCPGQAQADWFEVANIGATSASLLGYRIANYSDDLSQGTSFVVTQAVVLNAGQMAIFVRGMNAESFVRWWGADALPPGLPVITFFGFGLDDDTDSLYLWSPGAEDPLDPIDSISYAGAGEQQGVSKFAPLPVPFGYLPEFSTPRDFGAFVASECDDIGSPGYLTNPPPRLVSLSRSDSISTLRCRVIPGQTYRLKWKRRLTDAVWTTLPWRQAVDWVETTIDATAGNAEQRFYLLEETR